MFFKSSEFKMVGLYVFTSVCIYLGFWLGIYCLPYHASLGLSAVICVLAGIIFVWLRHKSVPAIVTTLVISFAIGMCISALFAALKLEPSRFFGLVLIIMLCYKMVQAALIYFIPSRKVANIILIILIVLEVAACIAVGVNTAKDPALLWQIFSVLLVCIFYSFGIMVMENSGDSTFWHTAAKCYIIGFVAIFVVIVLLIISLLAEDGSAFDGFGEFICGGMDVGSQDVSKRRKGIKNIVP